MSVFDVSSCGVVELGWLMWVINFVFIFLMLSVTYTVSGGRSHSAMEILLSVPGNMVKNSKMSALGGGSLLMKALFVIIYFANVIGLIPYTVSMSAHVVFSLYYGFSFWLALVVSSLVMGKMKVSVAKLVFSGLPLLSALVLCWMEMFSVFIRWFTLSLRLVANMTIGQIATLIFSEWLLKSYLGKLGLMVFGAAALSVVLLAVELAVGLIQAYIFCLLLCVYSDDHSFSD